MSDPRSAVLGVEHSLTDKRWEASPADDRLALALRQRHNLSDDKEGDEQGGGGEIGGAIDQGDADSEEERGDGGG